MSLKVQASNAFTLPTMHHHREQDLLYYMSPQVVDTMMWRFGVSNGFIILVISLSMVIIQSVIEDPGAMPDLEDREGEVSSIR